MSGTVRKYRVTVKFSPDIAEYFTSVCIHPELHAYPHSWGYVAPPACSGLSGEKIG